jgi:hypothetical protein
MYRVKSPFVIQEGRKNVILGNRKKKMQSYPVRNHKISANKPTSGLFTITFRRFTSNYHLIIFDCNTYTAQLRTMCRSSKIYRQNRTTTISFESVLTGAIPFSRAEQALFLCHFTVSRGYTSTKILHRPRYFIFIAFKFLSRGLRSIF